MNLTQINILLADDDADDCIFFEAAVGGIKLLKKMITVHDGEQLMHHLANVENELPDVLFLDLNMPRKNGFECLSEIKQNKKLKALSVVVFSTSFEQEVVNQLYHNGAQYFVRKPSEFKQFKKIILHTLDLLTNENTSVPNKESFVLTNQTV